MNVVVISGRLVRPVEERVLAGDTRLVSMELAALDTAGKRETVPVSWADPAPGAVPAPGEHVVVRGRVRRRFFRAGGTTQSRTEVVAERVVRVEGEGAECDALADAARALVAALAAVTTATGTDGGG